MAGRILVRVQAEMPDAGFALVEAEGADTCTRLQLTAARPGFVALERARLRRPYEKAITMLFMA